MSSAGPAGNPWLTRACGSNGKSVYTGRAKRSVQGIQHGLPLAGKPPLALPDKFSAGTRNGFSGKFLLQGLPANWTISAPHIITCHFFCELNL